MLRCMHASVGLSLCLATCSDAVFVQHVCSSLRPADHSTRCLSPLQASLVRLASSRFHCVSPPLIDGILKMAKLGACTPRKKINKGHYERLRCGKRGRRRGREVASKSACTVHCTVHPPRRQGDTTRHDRRLGRFVRTEPPLPLYLVLQVLLRGALAEKSPHVGMMALSSPEDTRHSRPPEGSPAPCEGNHLPAQRNPVRSPLGGHEPDDIGRASGVRQQGPCPSIVGHVLRGR